MNHNDTAVPVGTASPGCNQVPPADTNTPDTSQVRRSQEITAALRDDIKKGSLAPGQQLLPLEEMRQHFRCDYRLLLAVYRQLEAEDLIVRRRNVGVFVAGDEPAPSARQRVRDTLREKIRNGTYKPGDRLPDHRTLASQIGVSRTTLILALSELKAEGLVEAHRRHGTFVTGGQPPQSNAAIIADKVRRQISDGTLKPGDRLPSVAALAPEYGFSASTIGAALRILQAEGLVVCRARVGTRVATSRADG